MPDLHATAPLTPLDIAACIRGRIEERHPRLKVYGALDLTAAKPQLHVPCVVVLPLEDMLEEVLSPDPDEAVVQRMTSTVATVVGVGNQNDPGGWKGKAADSLMSRLAGIRASLLGWPPGGPFPTYPPTTPPHAPASPARTWVMALGRPEPLVWRRGRLVLLAESKAWWQDEYSTRWVVAGDVREDEPVPFADVTDVCSAPAAPEGAESSAPEVVVYG